jgi:hypothetical protein
MKTAVVVTTYNRPACLARSLPYIMIAARKVNAPVLVIDDGSPDASDYAREGASIYGASFIGLPWNRGLAGAMNIGLSFFLADPEIEAIHYFQDDVEVDPLALAAINDVLAQVGDFCVTGHDAKEHHAKPHSPICDSPFGPICGIMTRLRPSCRATQMSALRSAWTKVMPIRSKGLGLPKRVPRAPNDPEQRGEGSSVDWWIVRDAPRRLDTICIPGLVRSFSHKAEDSTWGNPQIAGEDGPLHREAIKGWVK